MGPRAAHRAGAGRDHAGRARRVVAGAVCAVALPHLIGSSIDLSAFTGTSAAVEFSPDALALGCPPRPSWCSRLAALVAQARTGSRRGITGHAPGTLRE